MKFLKSEMKNKYWTYCHYLEARCEALPEQLEKKFKNIECYHESSSCYGMSNYINVEIQDNAGDSLDSFDIRISDHEPTGSGEHCEKYIYITDKEWKEVKKEVFTFIENKLSEFKN